MSAPLRRWVVLWAIGGVVLLLLRALWRLAPIAAEPLRSGEMTSLQAGLYGAWVVVNVHAEGYRGFHLRFAPRVVARAIHLARDPSAPLGRLLLAPAYAMGLFHASRKRMITSWTVFAIIVGLVLAVRELDQPWRGIVDGGVVAGLAVGLASLLLHAARGLAGRPTAAQLDLPRRGGAPGASS